MIVHFLQVAHESIGHLGRIADEVNLVNLKTLAALMLAAHASTALTFQDLHALRQFFTTPLSIVWGGPTNVMLPDIRAVTMDWP